MRNISCEHPRILLGSKKETIVFIHGALGTLHHFDWYADAFNKEGYTTYQLALPFHTKGLGQKLKGLSVMDYVRAVKQELIHITEHIILIGHSMGGVICQRIAAEMPQKVKKLVLIASAPPRGIHLWNPNMVMRIFSKWKYLKAIIFGSSIAVDPVEQEEFLFNNFSAKNEKDNWAKRLLPESGTVLRELCTWSIPVKEIYVPLCMFYFKEDALIPEKVSRQLYAHYWKKLHGCYAITGGHYAFLDPVNKENIKTKIHYFLCS